MKCKDCKTKNILKADFCKGCGHQFTEKEKQKAYNKTVFGVIDKILGLKDYITLDFIAGNKLFKAASLIVILLYSFLVLEINGNEMKILDSREYDIYYNKTSKEYFLDAKKDNITLKLYLPNNVTEIDLLTMDSDDNVLKTESYSAEDKLVLEYDSQQHYMIKSGRKKLEVFILNN